MTVRYAYAITTALLLGGAAITIGTNAPVGAQTAQNAPQFLAAPPQPGAPVSFRDLAARLQPSVVNISTKQTVKVANQAPNFPFELFGMEFRETFDRPDDCPDDWHNAHCRFDALQFANAVEHSHGRHQ